MSSFTISPTETAWLSARHHRAVRAGVLGDLHGSSSLGAKLFRYRRSILAGCLLLAIANTLTIYGNSTEDRQESVGKRPGRL